MKTKLLTIKARRDDQPGKIFCFSCWENHLDNRLSALLQLGYEIVEVR